jgi:ubiquitin-protein ligase
VIGRVLSSLYKFLIPVFVSMKITFLLSIIYDFGIDEQTMICLKMIKAHDVYPRVWTFEKVELLD